MILNIPVLLKTCWLRQISRCTIIRMARRGLMEKDKKNTKSQFTNESAKLRLRIIELEKSEAEHKEAEQTLRESEEKYRLLADNTLDCIWQMDKDLSFTYVNPAIFSMLGFTQDEWIGTALAEHCSPDEMKKVITIIAEELEKKETHIAIFEMYLIHKDGREIPVEINGKIIKDENRDLIGFQGSTRDIIERKQAEQDIKKAMKKLQTTLEKTVNALAAAVGKRDPYTASHQQRVTKLAIAIAEEMDFSKEQVQGIRIAGLLHDIGKISVPAEILGKPAKLTPAEFEIVKSHSHAGYDILKSIEFPWPVAEIVLQHHERINGLGYPQGFLDKDILIEAKILGVADVVEAMCSHRPYRSALGVAKTLKHILQNKGSLFDPEVVDVCVRLFKEKGFRFE